MEFKSIKGGIQMDDIKRRKEEKDRERLKDGIKIVAVVAVGAGLYGFKLGRRVGYRKGVHQGYMEASNEFISVMKEISEDLKKSI